MSKIHNIGLESKVTITKDATILGYANIPAKYCGTKGTIIKVRDMNQGYSKHEEFDIRMDLDQRSFCLGREQIENAGPEVPFGKDTIEEARRIGGNASIQSLLNQRISAGTTALQYACQNDNKDFNSKIALAEKNIREAKMLFKSLAPAPKA